MEALYKKVDAEDGAYSAAEVLSGYDQARITGLATALRAAINSEAQELGICGAVKAYNIIPWLCATSKQTLKPGYRTSYPLGTRHESGQPWSKSRKAMAQHCLSLIELYLQETAPSKSYKPTHGGYPNA
jgi:hypothetical protein